MYDCTGGALYKGSTSKATIYITNTVYLNIYYVCFLVNINKVLCYKTSSDYVIITFRQVEVKSLEGKFAYF